MNVYCLSLPKPICRNVTVFCSTGFSRVIATDIICLRIDSNRCDSTTTNKWFSNSFQCQIRTKQKNVLKSLFCIAIPLQSFCLNLIPVIVAVSGKLTLTNASKMSVPPPWHVFPSIPTSDCSFELHSYVFSAHFRCYQRLLVPVEQTFRYCKTCQNICLPISLPGVKIFKSIQFCNFKE